jgi:hypothetical protein
VASAIPADAIDGRVHTSGLAGTSSSPDQDLRSPDARDAARPQTPADVTAALAQEGYYSSYCEPEPPAAPQAPSPPNDTPWFAIALSIGAALAIVAASATHLLRLRRRRAARATI